jgi:hypothetical protein
MKRIIKCSLFFVILSVQSVIGQELRCNISVSAQKIQGANKTVFETMQSDLYEFMNNKKWTDHKYSMDERIECNIFINLEEQISSDEFKGTMQVQVRRPIFNSSYESILLNINDKNFHAKYVEFQTLEFNETSNKDNLTSMLAFYAYIILGMDYDSFSLEGGTEYFQKAQAIVNNSKDNREKGWKSMDERNRYWLIENILNKTYAPFRACTYQYHRLGLDLMAETPEEGRRVIAESLKSIQKVFRLRPSLYIVQVFFDAKSDEMVNIFSKANSDEKNRVLTILNECDPSNGSKYEKISKSESF